MNKIDPIVSEVLLELDAPASPARVAKVAQMLADALHAADPDLASESVTLVVDNLDLKARLRARDRAGEAAVRRVTRVLANPLEAVQEHAGDRPIAAALGRKMKELVDDGGRFTFTRDGRDVTRKVDRDLRGALDVAGTPPPATRTGRGTTTLYSRVLRVGQASAGAQFRARLVVFGDHREVRVTPGAEEAFVEARRRGGMHRISVRGRWRPGAGGRLALDLDSLEASSAVPWQAVGGEELLAGLDELESFSRVPADSIAEELGIETTGPESDAR